MNRAAAASLLVLVTGCSTTPEYDTRFGDAVREARLKMTIDPDAGKKHGAQALAGIDGKAAHEAVARYHESFKAPPPVVNVINIGGSISSSK